MPRLFINSLKLIYRDLRNSRLLLIVSIKSFNFSFFVLGAVEVNKVKKKMVNFNNNQDRRLGKSNLKTKISQIIALVKKF